MASSSMGPPASGTMLTIAAKTSIAVDALLDEFSELDAEHLAGLTLDELAEVGAALRVPPPGVLQLDEEGIAEIRRRIAEVDAGTAELLTTEEAIASIRAELDL